MSRLRRTKCPTSYLVGLRKPDAECTPATDFAFGSDLAALSLDQCLTYRKTETGSALAFRCKEGIEDFFYDIRIHADSGVGHFDDDARIAVALRIECPQRKRATVRHRVDCIDDQVDQHLLQLGAVHQDKAACPVFPCDPDFGLVQE